MSRTRDIEQKLQRILKGRQRPVDQERLEAMRGTLLSQDSVRAAPPQASGFFVRHRFGFAFATALVLAGLLAWQIYPHRPGDLTVSDRAELSRVVADENQLDGMLAVLNEFAYQEAQPVFLSDWDFYGRSWLQDADGERLVEVIYGLEGDSALL